MAAAPECHPAQTRTTRNVLGHDLYLYSYGDHMVVWSAEGQVLGTLFQETPDGYSLASSVDDTPRPLSECLEAMVGRIGVERV